MIDRHPVPANPDPLQLQQGWSASPGRDVDWFSDDEENKGRPLRSYLAILYRYRILLVIAALFGAAGAYVMWNLYVPEYSARGTIWVQGNNDRATAGPVETGQLLPAESWMDLLRSFALLEPVVRRERLYIEPKEAADFPLFGDVQLVGDIRPGSYEARASTDGKELLLLKGDTVVDRAPPDEPVGEAFGIAWVVPQEALERGRPVGFSLRSIREAADRLGAELGPDSQMDRTGSFITVGWSDRDPQRAAAVVNAVMEEQVSLAGQLKGASLDEEYEILRQQLDYTQNELSNAERALETFRVQTITLPSDQPIQAGLEMTRDPVFNEFFQMRVDQETIRRDVERLEAVAAAIPTSGIQVEALELIPSAANSTQLQDALSALTQARVDRTTLKERYTDEYPSVQQATARIDDLENNQIPALLSQLVQTLKVQEEVLGEQLQASERDLTQIPPRAIEEARLRRNVQVAEGSYLDLQERFQTASLARRSGSPDLRVLDRAQAPEYSSAGIARLGLPLAVFAIFLGLGAGVALFLAHLDSRLRSPEEVSAAFGLTVLGAVPRIERSNGRKSSQDVRNIGQIYEAFRELRTNLIYAYGNAGPIVLTISSPGMGEGKTTISTNLGIAFAELGRRTLLVDADTRRGDMHHFLGGRRKPGLTDYLSMKVSGSEVLQPTSHEGLDFIGSGTQVANSPELLASREMGEMMAALRKEYDVILVDSPPLGAGADPLVLATITGHMLVVVRSGSTDREFTQAKLEPLNRLPVRLLGAVMNDYEPSRIGDGYQYYANYLPGYEAGAEEASEAEDEVARALAAAATPARFGEDANG